MQLLMHLLGVLERMPFLVVHSFWSFKYWTSWSWPALLTDQAQLKGINNYFLLVNGMLEKHTINIKCTSFQPYVIR